MTIIPLIAIIRFMTGGESYHQHFSGEQFAAEYNGVWTDIDRADGIINESYDWIASNILDETAPPRPAAIKEMWTTIDANEVEKEYLLKIADRNLVAAREFLNSDRSDEYYDSAYAEKDVYNNARQPLQATPQQSQLDIFVGVGGD